MKTRLTLIAVILTTIAVYGQTEATTKDGKKVILNSDGTWKYAEDKESLDQKLPENLTDCSNWISTTEDKVSGNKTTGSTKILVVSDDGGKTGFGIYWFLSSHKSIILSIQAAGEGGCIDENTKINILFKDASRLELRTDGKFNCDGEATTYFLGMFGKKSQLEQLTTKKIETMRVWTSKSYVEKNFDDIQAETFMRTAKCLYDGMR